MRERLQKSFDIVMAKQEKEKANNNNKVKAKNKTISKLKNDLDKKTKELNEKNKQNEKLTLKVQNIENSKSWKLTKPLRHLGKIIEIVFLYLSKAIYLSCLFKKDELFMYAIYNDR
ncbi:hypothetical protein TMUPMC115_1615 [Tetragenococcus muriaticus PMC-11-5]|uniref:Uncharacterized protein n=1 Tax=Tetragenococcus muriaticus PMC-11-5 TaxID=1302649 RepID=A0A091C272_9ENTE|nr:hypothetical protein TMUPMC115_1615 [Tetragenococcus muriaticus PMC-11-5]